MVTDTFIFFQSENCGLLAANIPKRYSKLGTAGKTVPGIKSKVTTTENMPKGYFTEGTGMDGRLLPFCLFRRF